MEASNQHSSAAEQRSRNIPFFSNMAMWSLVLMMYVILLLGIGYIAFWDQDFNKPNHTVEPYIEMIINYKKQVETQSGNAPLTEEEFTVMVQEIMKENAENAGDLQKLASQSFNIILGAILAFLSASATMVFQRVNSGGRRASD